MSTWEFVDLATLAKQRGTNEKVMAASVLSGTVSCYVHAANLKASAHLKEPLPSWLEDRFPMIEWKDQGVFQPKDLVPHSEWRPPNRHSYRVNGWLQLDKYSSQEILSRRIKWNDITVYVVNSCETRVSELELLVDGDREWVSTNGDEYIDGGYYRHVPRLIGRDDLFFKSEDLAAQRKLSSRKEGSYLGIIAAMRALLRDRDGGNFPSDAKTIDQLVNKYGELDGVSKRNLESVFSEANRATTDRTKIK